MTDKYKEDEYPAIIASSCINGQNRQAVKQFREAVANNCDVHQLIASIQDHLGTENTLKFLGNVFAQIEKDIG